MREEEKSLTLKQKRWRDKIKGAVQKLLGYR